MNMRVPNDFGEHLDQIREYFRKTAPPGLSGQPYDPQTLYKYLGVALRMIDALSQQHERVIRDQNVSPDLRASIEKLLRQL
ncbi:MAG: hypothetical protein ABSG12_11910 [Steroidobacteraceae bacterium]|jgi:hypothetical protein